MSGERILIVEDERVTAMDERDLPENLGYEVTSIANTGQDAIRKAVEEHPDLVLMDIVLDGEIDGIKAANAIREQNDIPIIFVTANTKKRYITRAKRTKPYGYVIKPFNADVLETNIEIALYNHRVEQALKQSEQFLRDVTSTLAEGVYVLDVDGHLIFMNPEAERLLGWRQAELSLQDAHEEIHGHHHGEGVSETECRVLLALHSGEVQRVDDDIFFGKDGHSFPVSYTAAPMLSPSRRIDGVVVAFQNIAKRKRLERKLKLLAAHDPLTGLYNRNSMHPGSRSRKPV